MNNVDITKLSFKHLMEHFEQERREWLEMGMNEADIFRVHFGDENESKKGDYHIWLNERSHTRSDHKYARQVIIASATK
jgi:hypothetical protein